MLRNVELVELVMGACFNQPKTVVMHSLGIPAVRALLKHITDICYMNFCTIDASTPKTTHTQLTDGNRTPEGETKEQLNYQ